MFFIIIIKKIKILLLKIYNIYCMCVLIQLYKIYFIFYSGIVLHAQRKNYMKPIGEIVSKLDDVPKPNTAERRKVAANIVQLPDKTDNVMGCLWHITGSLRDG